MHILSVKNYTFIPLGNLSKASSRVRIYWLLDELLKRRNENKYFPNVFFLKYLQIVTNPFVIIQKNTSKYHLILAKVCKFFGKTVIFDIDDYPSKNDSEVTLINFRKMCTSVDIVLAGSPNLVTLCKQYNTNVFLLPSGIKIQNYTQKNFVNKKRVCLGWIGNGNHYAQDLIITLTEPLKVLSMKYDLKLKIVGANNNASIVESFSSIEGLQFEHVHNLDWSNPKEIDEAMNDFDIGLYPLIETFFNSFKCGFKALEYYAKGLPVVSSNVAMNKDIVLHEKTGYIVDTPEDWMFALESLISDIELRKKMGICGFEHIRKNYAIERVALQFNEILLND